MQAFGSLLFQRTVKDPVGLPVGDRQTHLLLVLEAPHLFVPRQAIWVEQGYFSSLLVLEEQLPGLVPEQLLTSSKLMMSASAQRYHSLQLELGHCGCWPKQLHSAGSVVAILVGQVCLESLSLLIQGQQAFGQVWDPSSLVMKMLRWVR